MFDIGEWFRNLIERFVESGADSDSQIEIEPVPEDALSDFEFSQLDDDVQVSLIGLGFDPESMDIEDFLEGLDLHYLIEEAEGDALTDTLDDDIVTPDDQGPPAKSHSLLSKGSKLKFGKYGRCYKCACPGFMGSGYTCSRGGCGHHFDDHG